VRRLGVAIVACACALAIAHSAVAVTHQATIGNYYYEDDSQRDQTKIVVHQGEQITFTVRQAAVPGHTVDVDALNVHSPNLNIGETFTTPRLSKPGNFYLYCRPHEDRGHHTRLIVLAAATSPPSTKPTATPSRTATPPHIARVAPRTPAPAATPSPTATLTPVGLGSAPPGALERPLPTNPNSLSALTGRKTASGVPWTRSLWWLLIASVPIVGAAGYAWRRAATAPPPPAPPKRKSTAKRKR
jgi:plastocyanin